MSVAEGNEKLRGIRFIHVRARGGSPPPVRAGYAVFSLSGTSKVSTYFEVAGDV